MPSALEETEKAIAGLRLSDDVLRQISAKLLDQFNKGLGRATHNDAEVKMFVTYVRDVPDGTETGKYIALDLGGTNFRVLLITIRGETFDVVSHVFAVPYTKMTGSGIELFDHIAECLKYFIKSRNVTGDTIPLGFTFSFPCQQDGLNSARLIGWTKGFSCSDVVGKDVVQLLCEALERKRVTNIKPVTLVNDTTGTLMACSYKDRECRVGLIVGTGSNACYMEKLENVELFVGEKTGPAQVIINTEWGAFGDKGSLDFITTPYDKDIDKNSLNPGKQTFEKMISGMYMGELVRRIAEKLARDGILFKGKLSEKMTTVYAFKTKYVSMVENDPKCDKGAPEVLAKMEQLGTPQDCECLKRICEVVSTRASHLVATGIATILNRLKRPSTAVGVDGSVYRFHPHFHRRMVAKLEQLVNPAYKFTVVLTEDGSGCGAAIAAAVAARHK
ncbi:hexokinase type 2-like [Ornithodoros turicata]|uniref:hexokinase type 2-like n=1 Tax=Ornithodoros turicata TaxID=34597 RepID=UPI00313997B5